MTLRRVLFCVLGLAALASSACGVGQGTAILLPAGPQTQAAPGNVVMYVAEARGNRVVVYRLGADGLLPAAPFDSMSFNNPRRLLLVGNVLYVGTDDGVSSLTLAADGSFPVAPTGETQPVPGSDVFEMAVRGGVLYAAFAGQRLIQAFQLDGTGQVPALPFSSGGTSNSDYRPLVISPNGFLYTGARLTARIDTFQILPDGSLPADPEVQDPATFLGRPDTMLVRGGILYVSNKSRSRIAAFEILPNGLLPEEPDSRTTSGEGAYEKLLVNGDLLYASAFNEGRIDVYQLESDGMLPSGGPLFSTDADVGTFPVGIGLQSGILYVTQAGRDRIDAYIVGIDGLPTALPSSSTVAIDGSFPTDLALRTLP